MILLLDAHALLWWLGDDRALAAGARRAIADPGNDVLVSAATVWEIEIKRSLGKLSGPRELVQALEVAGFVTLPVTALDGQSAARLPTHHRYPFDRILVAQATRLDALVVTRNVAFEAYDVQVLAA